MKRSRYTPKALGALMEAILTVRSAEEARDFFRDLCTLAELKAMTERWEVARRVAAGESYREISQRTGASTTTVTRVAHWVRHGTGGYRRALERVRKGGKS